MNPNKQETITADVRITDSLSGVVVTPRQISATHAVRGVLGDLLPESRLRRLADGTLVGAQDAAALLNLNDSIDLRWTAEARLFAENRKSARLVHPQLFEQVCRLRTGGKQLAGVYLSGVERLEALDDHQWVNVAAMTLSEGYGLCVFDEQGAGKTVTLIFAFDVLVGWDQVDLLLIVAPKSMVAEWPGDFERFTSDLYKVVVITGTRRQKNAALASDADVFVTNFETVVSMESELQALLRRYANRSVLAIDESFYAKNLDAKRTRSIRRLREWCGRAFVLCGTPAPNEPKDLVQQFNIVDFGLTFDDIVIPEDRETAGPIVQRAIEERGLFVRHLKADVLPQLPTKRFHRVLLSLQPEQKRLYTAALKDLVLDLRSVDDETFVRHLGSFLGRRTALLQICSNPISLTRGYKEVPTKLIALDKLLEETIRQRGEKVVLWSFYTASIDAIISRYSHFSPVRYDGTVSDIAQRREAVLRFQEDDTAMLFVGNPAAAGAGLTLHRARLAIYESMSNQAAHYLQSLDRIHRRGQTREVSYLILLCDRTIELEEYARLTRKENSAKSLLGDPTQEPWTRESMISEAINATRLIGE